MKKKWSNKLTVTFGPIMTTHGANCFVMVVSELLGKMTITNLSVIKLELHVKGNCITYPRALQSPPTNNILSSPPPSFPSSLYPFLFLSSPLYLPLYICCTVSFYFKFSLLSLLIVSLIWKSLTWITWYSTVRRNRFFYYYYFY